MQRKMKTDNTSTTFPVTFKWKVSGKVVFFYHRCFSVIAGLIAPGPGKKDSTSTLLQQNRSYCDTHGGKRLDFYTFTTKSVLLRHEKRQKTQLPRFCSNIGTKARQLTQKTHDPPYYDNLSCKSAKIMEKDSFSTLLRH